MNRNKLPGNPMWINNQPLLDTSRMPCEETADVKSSGTPRMFTLGSVANDGIQLGVDWLVIRPSDGFSGAAAPKDGVRSDQGGVARVGRPIRATGGRNGLDGCAAY